jgi:hypothetical protein
MAGDGVSEFFHREACAAWLRLLRSLVQSVGKTQPAARWKEKFEVAAQCQPLLDSMAEASLLEAAREASRLWLDLEHSLYLPFILVLLMYVRSGRLPWVHGVCQDAALVQQRP